MPLHCGMKLRTRRLEHLQQACVLLLHHVSALLHALPIVLQPAALCLAGLKLYPASRQRCIACLQLCLRGRVPPPKPFVPCMHLDLPHLTHLTHLDLPRVRRLQGRLLLRMRVGERERVRLRSQQPRLRLRLGITPLCMRCFHALGRLRRARLCAGQFDL